MGTKQTKSNLLNYCATVAKNEVNEMSAKMSYAVA